MANLVQFSRKSHPPLVKDRDWSRPQAGLIQVKLTLGATNASRVAHESSFQRNIFGTVVNSLRIIRSNTAPTPLNNAQPWRLFSWLLSGELMQFESFLFVKLGFNAHESCVQS